MHVWLTGFGTAISSAAPTLGGGLTTGFGTTGGLGVSAFGQQPTTGISISIILFASALSRFRYIFGINRW